MKKLVDNYRKYKELKELLKDTSANFDRLLEIIAGCTIEELEDLIKFMKKFIGIRAYEIIKYVDTNVQERIDIANGEVF